MKIYDCFIFYNEFDILELRLSELYDKVDYFVISEANTTHAGNTKDFLFLANWERFKPWADKIKHVRVTDMPGVINGSCWPNERHQRCCLTRALTHVYQEDIIILSDIDEIIRPSRIDQMRNDTQHNLWAFRMPCFNFKFNYMWTHPQIYHVYPQAFTVARAATFKDFTDVREVYGANWASGNRPMLYSDERDMCLQHGGWHFSSLGGTEVVANKYRNYAHNEMAWKADAINVDKLIAEGKTTIHETFTFAPVVLDNYFPQTILGNKEKYKNLILEGAEKTVVERLKDAGIDIPFIS
jgi:beta-1,4-mannosyl-glycoprotein beta-1,4-N-acetylglucosaminyltransferase